jgi:hypothetical protein
VLTIIQPSYNSGIRLISPDGAAFDFFNNDSLNIQKNGAVGPSIYVDGSSGNVGIGGTTSTSKLNVVGNCSIGYTDAAPSNGLIINGNVGIGLTNPGQKLDVNGNIKTSGQFLLGSVQIKTGSGAPNNNDGAPKGSLYLRTDGGTTTTLYVKTGTTTWTAK